MQTALQDAENICQFLFEAIERDGLVVAGKSEEQLIAEINELAITEFGILRHWHKKIVRAGPNTMAVYNDDPPNLLLQEDDIVFVDLGPVIKGWEADMGRTFIVGEDENKIKLKSDTERAWHETRQWFHQQSTLPASELFHYVVDKASEYGWSFGGAIAGHIVGRYPHEQPANPASVELDVHPDNHNDMLLPDVDGNKRSWILELHFTDTKNRIGAYFERLL